MPKTWAEFNADCDKAVAAKLICLAHFSQDWTDATTFENVVYGQNIDLFRKAFVQGDTEAMRSPEMIKAFDQMRLMVSKYMDPAIAGRDYDTATGMIAKGKAVFMIMGDWEIGMLHRRRPEGGRRTIVRAGANRLGQAGLHPQLGFGCFLQAERSRLCRGAKAARASHHVARVPDRLQSGQGLDPGADGRRFVEGVQPLPATLTEGPAGVDRRRDAGALDGAQHDGAAEVSRRDDGHHHLVREQAEDDVEGSRQTRWPTRSKRRNSLRDEILLRALAGCGQGCGGG